MRLAPAATASTTLSSGPAMLLLAASASPPRVLAPRAAAAPPELTVRPARWPDDYDAVCAVRKPTEFVVESGGAGFMGGGTGGTGGGCIFCGTGGAPTRRVCSALSVASDVFGGTLCDHVLRRLLSGGIVDMQKP